MMNAISPIKLFSFVVAVFLSGCGFSAPKVDAVSKPVKASLAPQGGSVTVSTDASKSGPNGILWKAGTSTAVYEPTDALIQSLGWDMRLTAGYPPTITSNGGQTAADFAQSYGKAAFSVVPDDRGDFVPTRSDEVRDFLFIQDTFEPFIVNGKRYSDLGPQFQNVLVNSVPTGLLSKYNEASHAFDLSQRNFILRTADGLSFYLIRFVHFSKNEKTFRFEWRKLE